MRAIRPPGVLSVSGVSGVSHPVSGVAGVSHPVSGVAGVAGVSCKSPRNLKKYNLVITRDIENFDLRGETKLMPPRKGKNRNVLNISLIYFWFMRGDLLGAVTFLTSLLS